MAKLLNIKKNFEWSLTKRKLVLFMPNYNGKRLTEASIRRIQTALPRKHWLIIIGNDNVDDNWDHLRDLNVVWFSLFHDTGAPRNGSFIRNYAIKRCNSELFMQKDGEVVLEGDAIHHAVIFCSDELGWRAGKICVLTSPQTETYLKAGNLDALGAEVKLIEPVVPGSLNRVRDYLLIRDGRVNFTSFFHYAYCVPTDVLKDIRGYDERYKFYGFEDTDCYLRLARHGMFLSPDYECYAIHLNHSSTVNPAGLVEMKSLFASCNFSDSPARNPKRWGEGV
jgi:hypothetical protein